MLLACDIGNTRFKFAVYDNEELIDYRISSYDNLRAELFRDYGITAAAISSVVPSAARSIVELLNESFSIDPFVISHKSLFNLKINYLTPETLGIDRICSCEGAFSIYSNSPDYKYYNDKVWIITVDSGTATTLNIVKYNAEFAGGIIMPGITTMAKSLSGSTAQLPAAGSEDYTGLIGRDTRSSIASGIINSTAGMIERACDFLKEQFGAGDIRIYITGGNSEAVSRIIKYENLQVKDLVLRGVKAVFEKNRITH